VSTVTTSQVASATADLAAGAVGAYAYLVYISASAAINPGFTYSGNSLRYGGTSQFPTGRGAANGGIGASLPGTWRAMSNSESFTISGNGYYPATLFLRIS